MSEVSKNIIIPPKDKRLPFWMCYLCPERNYQDNGSLKCTGMQTKRYYHPDKTLKSNGYPFFAVLHKSSGMTKVEVEERLEERRCIKNGCTVK